MTNPKERLVDFKLRAEPPSKLMARKIVENLSKNQDPLAGAFTNILDGYDDRGYTPSLAQIETWALSEVKAMTDTFAALHRDNADASGDINLTEILSKIAGDDGPNSMDVLVESLAKTFSWMDTPFFRGGSPLDAHWHGVQINSAMLQSANRSGKIVDTLDDLLQFALESRIHGATEFAGGFTEDPEVFKRSFDEKQRQIKSALEELSAIKDFAAKVGFLFRDAWWLDEHSDAALKGYLAKETAVKAGTAGGKASSTARAKRIEAFLPVHARMMSRNPILIDDSPEELAIRAMKIAKKANPGLFEKTSSKTAIEYWEYIRSDADLWKRYQEKIKYFK